jgi:hypothetical protein
MDVLTRILTEKVVVAVGSGANRTLDFFFFAFFFFECFFLLWLSLITCTTGWVFGTLCVSASSLFCGLLWIDSELLSAKAATLAFLSETSLLECLFEPVRRGGESLLPGAFSWSSLLSGKAATLAFLSDTSLLECLFEYVRRGGDSLLLGAFPWCLLVLRVW